MNLVVGVMLLFLKKLLFISMMWWMCGVMLGVWCRVSVMLVSGFSGYSVMLLVLCLCSVCMMKLIVWCGFIGEVGLGNLMLLSLVLLCMCLVVIRGMFSGWLVLV